MKKNFTKKKIKLSAPIKNKNNSKEEKKLDKSVEKIPKKKEERFNVVQENPVYIQLGYDESIESKKDFLSSELFLLNIIKIIKRYNSLRMQELDIKSQMYKAVRDLDASIRKMKSAFPFIKIPEKTRREEIMKIEAPIRRENFDENLESQLRNIQDKLKSMGS